MWKIFLVFHHVWVYMCLRAVSSPAQGLYPEQNSSLAAEKESKESTKEVWAKVSHTAPVMGPAGVPLKAPALG
jgi:hypothetical protein